MLVGMMLHDCFVPPVQKISDHMNSEAARAKLESVKRKVSIPIDSTTYYYPKEVVCCLA